MKKKDVRYSQHRDVCELRPTNDLLNIFICLKIYGGRRCSYTHQYLRFDELDINAYLRQALKFWTDIQTVSEVFSVWTNESVTLRSKARAKHKSCLWPADMEEPPSLTPASSPPSRESTNDLRCV